MQLGRRFGIVIVCGIPAIVGSGLLWALSESWIVVFGYLCLLVAALLVFVVNPRLFTSNSQIWNPTIGRFKGLLAKVQTLFIST